jgi:tetratricopeptide (TPR) repeat protein
MNETLMERLDRFRAEDDASGALRLIQEEEAAGRVTASLLVQKALCIQLLPDGSLDEAERCFQHALELDPDLLLALVEYGYFVLNVRNGAGRAQSIFRRALELRISGNTEIVIALLKALQDGNPSVPIHEAKRDLISSLVDDDKIDSAFR